MVDAHDHRYAYAPSMIKRIAWLGLGAMGSRMASRLLPHYDLTVYNRTPERAAPLIDAGATLAPSPRAAVEGADLVASIVTDDEAARELWLDSQVGAAQGLAPDTIVLESSTVTPRFVAELGATVSSRGATLLDAPVAGSTPQAEAGALAYLVGGPKPQVERAREVMEKVGQVVVHAGPAGRGATLKLIVNALFAGQVALMAELLRAGTQSGFETAALVDMLSKMPVTSPAAAGAGQLIAAGDHASRFPVRLVAKDLRYAQALGSLPITQAVAQRYDDAIARGLQDQNLTVV